MVTQNIKPTGCCNPFDPEPWEDKEIIWKDKPFVKDHVTSFFHIPLNMGKKVIKNMELIEKSRAEAPQQLMLTDEKSLWEQISTLMSPKRVLIRTLANGRKR